jgi:hypothetical protein
MSLKIRPTYVVLSPYNRGRTLRCWASAGRTRGFKLSVRNGVLLALGEELENRNEPSPDHYESSLFLISVTRSNPADRDLPSFSDPLLPVLIKTSLALTASP